jgi:hypothetical protein
MADPNSNFLILGSSYAATAYPGIVALSVAPLSATVPVAVGTNDPRMSNISSVTLGDTFATNQAFYLVSGVALPVTSVDITIPLVDGITLESGAPGVSVPAAMVHGERYETPLALPPGSPLFLGQTGSPASLEPSSALGDIWSVGLLHQDDSTHFVFCPTTPIKLA